ncbi:hypothetical protein D3Y57_01100 (plasmid) [Sphingomonas paeninsulae]|uniref:Uncharacterized protein n=1 Tax=Sphingomonas paeninsulae TaxID=2319844 RepID=A0A494TFU8_SPHPE|nr:hypothetical protein D3Y57_01100 [Sphingomonas paeninsulae]
MSFAVTSLNARATKTLDVAQAFKTPSFGLNKPTVKPLSSTVKAGEDEAYPFWPCFLQQSIRVQRCDERSLALNECGGDKADLRNAGSAQSVAG